MRATIIARLDANSAGAATESWEMVIASAEREPHARIPGSFRHDHQPLDDVEITTPITPAAVLVPIMERQDRLTVLLTRRTNDVTSHAGQISFPGGRIEAHDASPVETALRESEEEIGLSNTRVEPIGRLDNYVVGTGYRITPVVGLVDPPERFDIDPREVAEVFEVPLDFVLERANYRRERMKIKQFDRQFYVLSYGDHYIWGATAAILVNLREALSE